MSQLKLQILLGAVDKITAPLKAVSGQSKITAKDLADTKGKIRDLEKQAAQINGYKDLGKQIGVTRSKLKTAQVEAQALAKAMSENANPTKAMSAQLDIARQRVRDLSDAETRLVVKYGEAKAAVKSTGINTKQLANTQRRLKTDLAAANATLDSQRTKLGQLADQQKRMSQVKANYKKTMAMRDTVAGHGATGIATGVAMGMPVLTAVKEYASFEDAMKGVAKQVDGARDSNGKLTDVYYDMAKQIKAISEELPQVNGAIDIASLVEGAARMGVQGKDNLLNFVKTAAKAATAFELPADQLSEDMGKIANLYKIPISKIEQLGDAINFLDDNAQSKGADIINVLQRMGGVADKLDFKKAAALGSTFLSLGSAPEVAASAANAMVRELSIATMQGKRFHHGLDTLGMDSEAIQRAMSKDAMGTITKVLEKIKKLKPEKQMTVTTQLFGKEYGDDAAKLANNLGELYRQLKLVNAEKSKGSMQRESDIDKDSISSQVLLLKAGIDNLQSSLGAQLRGSLMEIIGYVQKTVGAIRGWVETNPELANTLVKVAAVTSGIAIALGSLALTVAALLGPLAVMRLTIGGLGVKFGGTAKDMSIFSRMMAMNNRLAAPLLAKWASLGNAIKGLTFARVGAGMKTMLTAIAGLPTKVGAMTASTWRYVTALLAASKATAVTKFTAMINGLRSATAATYSYVAANGVMGTAMNLLKGSVSGVISLLRGGLVGSLRLVGQTIAFVGRLLLMNPIGLLLTAIAIAALTIYRYWEPIKAFFAGFFQGLKEGMGPVAAVFAPAFEALAAALSPLKPIWDAIAGAVGTAWNWFSKLFEPIKTTQQELDGATSAGERFGLWVGGLVGSLAGVIAEFTKFGADLIDGMLIGIQNKWKELVSTVKGLTSYLPSWFTSGQVNVTANSAPALATGGYQTMLGASGYGPTIFQPKPLAPAGRGNSTVVNSTIQITQQPGQSPQDLAAEIDKRLKQHERQANARQRSTLRDTN